MFHIFKKKGKKNKMNTGWGPALALGPSLTDIFQVQPGNTSLPQ